MPAMKFGTATSDRVVIPSAASIDNLDPWTLMVWHRATTITAGRSIVNKGIGTSNNRRLDITVNASGGYRVSVDRSVGDLVYDSTTGNYVAGGPWAFVAATFNSSNAAGAIVNIYGSQNADPAANIIGSTGDGSGTFNSDAGVAFTIGNTTTGSPVAAYQGNIAYVALVGAELSLAEIRAWQFHYDAPIRGLLRKYRVGANGTGMVLDESGNGGHSTTVSGAIPVNDGVPYMKAKRRYAA